MENPWKHEENNSIVLFSIIYNFANYMLTMKNIFWYLNAFFFFLTKSIMPFSVL